MNSGVLKAENSTEPASLRNIVRNFQEDFNPFMSENQSGTVFIRVSIPELKVQKCLQFELDESVWQAKQRILSSFSKNLRDSLNYGLYMPPMNGRAGKFLDEERLLREYPLQGPIGFLEFKHKRRVYKLIHLNPRKLRQLHTKSNLKHFMENVRSGNTSKINKMTNKGIDPNFQESGTGETPLTLVTALDPQKSREIIISLVSGGAHLDFRTKQGMTAIHKAVLADNLTALKTLLDLGASTNYKDAHGLTPLYYSVMYQKSAVITETLLFERAFLGIHDEQGWQEVHQACRHGLVQHLEHLIFYGVDMNAATKTGNTPLHICAENNMENCARVLLFRGANRGILNFSNQSAQQTAIISGNMELAELIKNHKSEDVVPFKEMPSFSDRRGKSYMFSSNFSVLSRSRSDPKLNLAGLDMDIKNQQAQTVPTRAFKGPSQRFHTNFDYGSYPASQSSDSPKSLSISSSSSGPVLSSGDGDYWEGSVNGRYGYFPADHLQEVRLRRKAGSMEDLLGESRETLMMNRNTLAALVSSDSDNMSQKAIKKRTIENLRSSPQLKHQSQSHAVSETEKETTQSKKLPKWVLPLNKFIALPNGLRVKSHSDPSDSSSPPRGRSVPLKAVPLDDPISTGIVSDDQLHVYISSPQGTPIQPDPFIAIDRDFQTSTPRSVTPDISGTSTPRGIITPRGSLSSADSAKGRISKYRQRSSSTPPDFGRRQPLPEKLGLGNGLTDRSGTDQTNNGWFNANLDVFNDSITTVSTESSIDYTDQADSFTSSLHRERSASFGGPTPSAGPSSDLRFCFDFNHIPAGQKVIVTPHYAPPHNSSIIKHRKGTDMDKINMESGIVNEMAHVNGSIPGDHSKNVLIYRPSNSNEVIMMGNHAEPWQNNSGYELSTLGRKDGTNLLHARARFSSMPTVLSSKGDKKLLKILKKQEKEERKRIEKEEKKRAKEEKKRRKLEQKLLNKTLPRNWNYVNRPIESVYSRQKLSLSTVPIDIEDGPRNSPPPTTAPPPPPQPSLRTRSFYSSAPDLLRLEQIYGGASVSSRISEHSPRTVVLQRGSEGYGFVLRGAKSQLKPSGELDFRPTSEFPALQYLDNVDAGSPSDKAGLKPGDFILEINGENVVRASHDRVVNLIRASGNTLAMKVVTVRSTGRSQDWFVNQDHSKTMPNRKKKAPEPPRRDPHTSLSYSRAEGQNIAEEMKAMEKLDKAISGERRDSTTSTEQKTASIRGRHAVKRVSCIDTENLEVDQQKSNHISPSEARINKYHKGQNGALERSKSNPDLCGKPVYATPQVPDSANSTNGSNGTRVYDLPHGGQQSQPSPTNSRPKVAPPQPPSPVSKKSQRKQAPSPPSGEADMPNKSEVVSITTNRKSQYAGVPHPGKPIEGSQFESSFRPGTSAKLTEEPTTTVPSLEQSKFKPGHTRSSSTGAGLIKMATVPLSNAPKEDSGEKITFAEDKVHDSAVNFMKSYPSAQLLVTADVHNSIKDKKNSKLHEPEPDYDIDSGDEKKNVEPKAQVSAENNHKVTLISVGVESKTKPAPGSKRYTIHSTIPVEKPEENIEKQDVFIPPRPAGPAPIPPKNEERTWTGSRRSSFQSESSLPNSGNSSPRGMEVRMQKDVLAPPPPPPPAPPPPPVPSSPKSEVRFSQFREMNADKPALPTEDILAAVAKRRERLEVDGPRITMHKPEVKPSPRDRTQVAILEAVAKRRSALQHQSETAVVDSIENQLQKTKKLQAAKFSFTMNQRSNSSSETNVKVSTNDNSKSLEATDKVQSKPHVLPVNSKPIRTEEKSKQPVKADIKSSNPSTKPMELSIKIGAKSSGDSLPSMTELKPKILQKSDSTKTKVETVGKTPLQKPDIKEATKPNIQVQNVGKHEEKTEDTEVKMRPKKNDETGQNGNDKSNRNSDFVQLAEIKRQEWLQRRASQSTKSNSTSKQTSPDTSKPGSPDRSWKKGLIQIKPVSDKPIGSAVIMKDATTDQSNTDTMVKGQTLNGDVNHNDRNRQSKNVNSVKSPPSASRDRKEVNAVVQLEIIPPPSSFLSESSIDLHDINNHHRNGPSFSPDSASIVSSLSTLSSLSGDNNDTNPHGYEDMIAPPPPGFDDGTNSADNFDEVARVIPPPPEFGNGYSSDKSARPFASKPVESWLCNDVLDWLDSLNMGQYKSSFQQNSIDGKNLVSFTRSNYIELGVTQVGHRMNLERAIKKLAMHQNHSNIIESERL